MNRPLLRRDGVALAFAALIVAMGAPVADAHTFLVRTSPSAGARLTSPPGEVVLDFTETVASESTIELRDGNGDLIQLLSVNLDSGSQRLRASLPPLADGVYQATWLVVAEDGHTTEGEFVFAVGADLPAGAVMTNGSTSTPVRWADALAALVLLGGLAGRPAIQSKGAVLPSRSSANLLRMFVALRKTDRAEMTCVGCMTGRQR